MMQGIAVTSFSGRPMVRHAERQFVVASIPFLLLVAVGCGSQSAPIAKEGQDQLKVLGMLYGMFMSEHRGAAPVDQAEFVSFLGLEPANWEKIAGSPEELLNSPRTGEPLVVLYGEQARSREEGEFPWIAYESQPVDGRRLIVNARGNVQAVDEDELSQLVPPI